GQLAGVIHGEVSGAGKSQYAVFLSDEESATGDGCVCVHTGALQIAVGEDRRYRVDGDSFSNLNRIVGAVGAERLIEKIAEGCLGCLISHSVEVGQIVGNNGQRLRRSLQSGKWNRKIRHGLTLLLFGSCLNRNLNLNSNLNSKCSQPASSDGSESAR